MAELKKCRFGSSLATSDGSIFYLMHIMLFHLWDIARFMKIYIYILLDEFSEQPNCASQQNGVVQSSEVPNDSLEATNGTESHAAIDAAVGNGHCSVSPVESAVGVSPEAEHPCEGTPVSEPSNTPTENDTTKNNPTSEAVTGEADGGTITETTVTLNSVGEVTSIETQLPDTPSTSSHHDTDQAAPSSVDHNDNNNVYSECPTTAPNGEIIGSVDSQPSLEKINELQKLTRNNLTTQFKMLAK